MSGAAGSEPPSPADPPLPAGDHRQPASPHYPFLSPEEQELAALVYGRTVATARELVETLSTTMSAAQVQAALDQLVSKQVLRETKAHGCGHFYVQALRQSEIQQSAALRFAEEQFDGSLPNAVRLLLFLIHMYQPDELPGLSCFLESAIPPSG